MDIHRQRSRYVEKWVRQKGRANSRQAKATLRLELKPWTTYVHLSTPCKTPKPTNGALKVKWPRRGPWAEKADTSMSLDSRTNRTLAPLPAPLPPRRPSGGLLVSWGASYAWRGWEGVASQCPAASRYPATPMYLQRARVVWGMF